MRLSQAQIIFRKSFARQYRARAGQTHEEGWEYFLPAYSKRKPGASRDEVIDHLTSRLNPSAWDLIRQEKLIHLYYLTGEEPGFFAIVKSDDIEEVKHMAGQAISNHDLFDVEILPINLFPQFSKDTKA